MDKIYLRYGFIVINLVVFVTFILFSQTPKDEFLFVGRHLSETERNFSVERGFQKIGSETTNEKHYLYSAYYQRSSSMTSIVILAGLKAGVSNNFYCQLYSKDGFHYATVKAGLKEVAVDNHYHDLPYESYYINCNFEDGIHEPTFVSIFDLIASERDAQLSNVIRVIYKSSEEKYKFSLCVQPSYNYEDPIKFMEWVEFHRLMGVEKISLYNTSIGPETSCVIHSYGDLIEVFPWKNPYTEEEFWSHAQTLASHECLWRYKGVSDYLVIVDFDEMIVPRNTDNYSKMISDIDSYFSESKVVAYVFTHSLYCTNWKCANKAELHNSTHLANKSVVANVYKKLVTSTKVIRKKSIEKRTFYRTKYIVIPEHLLQLSIHHTSEITGNGVSENVPFNIANLHHYRDCSSFGPDCSNTETVIDNSAQLYSEIIATAIMNNLLSNSKQCNVEGI